MGLTFRLRPRLTQLDAERMDAEREQQALQEKLIRCRMLLSEFPEGVRARIQRSGGRTRAKNSRSRTVGSTKCPRHPDRLKRGELRFFAKIRYARGMQLLSVLTCPHCQHRATETMPTNACQFFYNCAGFGKRLKPLLGDCCMFCSFGTVPCPPIQENGKGAGCARQGRGLVPDLQQKT